MATSSQDANWISQFTRNVGGTRWSGDRRRACREAVIELGKLHPADSYGFGSGCLFLAQQGFSEELVSLCQNMGGTAHYEALSWALSRAGDIRSLEKLARKGSKDERWYAEHALAEFRS